MFVSFLTPHRLTGTLHWFDLAGSRQLSDRHVDQPHVETRHLPAAGPAHAADELAGGAALVVRLDDVVAQGLGVCPEVCRGVGLSLTVCITDSFYVLLSL